MANDDFARNLAALIGKVKDKQDMVVRKVALDLHTSMVLKSPVDTGRFRGNWQVGVGAVNADTSAPADASGSAVTARAEGALSNVKAGGVIFMTNSLPYARVLEYGQFGKPPGSANGPKTSGGYSKQAPAGMVHLTVTEYERYLQEAVGAAK